MRTILPFDNSRANGRLRHLTRTRILSGLALMLLAGALLAFRLVQPHSAEAASDRVYELRVYHALPGKLPAIEARFRDTTSKLLAQHNLNVVAYWVSDEAGPLGNSFIWVVAHASREEAKKNWDAFRMDPAFQRMVREEQADKLVEKIDSTYMRPSDFSGMK